MPGTISTSFPSYSYSKAPGLYAYHILRGYSFRAWSVKEGFQNNLGLLLGNKAGWKIGITEQTCYRWRREYGGMHVERDKKIKSLEKENVRFKKPDVDISLNNAILKEAEEGNL